MDNNTYLTEYSLGIFLSENFKYGEWIHDKKFIGRSRPDYRNDYYKLIVEFDGFLHYTSAKRIITDMLKDEEAESVNYNVIHIPYFVQLSTNVCKNIFKIDNKIEQIYKHGFIDEKCILPADFCELGITRFKNDLNTFLFLKDDIIKSLENKVQTFKNINLVLPPSLQYLIK